MQIENIQVAEQVETAEHDQCDAAPEFPVLDRAELLLKPVDRRLERNSLRAEHTFLRRVIRLERHVEVKSSSRKGKKSGVRCISDGNKRSENQDMDGCLH